MRRSREEAAKTRERAVRAAAKLFRARGFDGVGLKEIMRAIGMTHGGFYRHFSSKTQLMSEAVASASRDTVALRTSEEAMRLPAPKRFRAFVEGYLSMDHVAHAERGCPLAALAGEGGRQPSQTRKAFGAAIEAALAPIAAGMGGGAKGRTRAMQTLAALVGAVALARAAGDATLAAEILTAARWGVLDAAGG